MKKISGEELKKVQVQILDVVSDFCEKNGIMYWLDGGTLIGAIRHKGFIPWDDDIDLGMLRADYNIFMEKFNETNDRYKFISCELDSSPYPFGKVVDTTTILFEPNERGVKTHINIDIFPYDDAPNSKEEVDRLFTVRDHCLRLYILQEKLLVPNRKWKSLVQKIVGSILQLFPKRYFAKKEVRNALLYSDSGSKYIANFCGVVKMICEKRVITDGTTYAEFEGKKYKIPQNYHEWLTGFYGDYMQLPPIEQRISHHDFVAYSEE